MNLRGDRLLPHSIDAERATLGAMAVAPDGRARARAIVGEADFYREPHRKVFRAMITLEGQHLPVDLVLLKQILADAGELDTAGGPAYLAGLVDGVPQSANVEHYARIVREKALDRDAIEMASQYVGILFDRNGAPPGENRDQIESAAKRLRDIMDRQEADKATRHRLTPVKLADYDPAAKVPILAGDPDGEALIAADDLMLFCGEVGSGKSLSLADLGLAAAFGQSFLGHAINSRLRVMLCLADGDGERPTQRRLYRLAQGRGLTAAGVDNCGRFRLYVPAGFNLDAASDFAELRRELDDFDPDLLCIESLSSLTGPQRGGLMYQDQAADFAATRLRPLQHRPDGTRRAVIVGHHLTKPKQEKGGGRVKDRTGGSFYVLGAVDAALGFEIAGPESFKLRAVKRSRWGCSFAPFLVTITGQKDEPLHLKNCGPLQESEAKRDKAEGDVMTAVAALDGPEGYIMVADTIARLGAARNTAEERAVYRAIARLVKAGYLERGKRGTVRLTTRPAEGDE